MERPPLDHWIIETLFDTDIYKLTMLQAFYHAPEFMEVDARWKFACRNLNGFDLSVLIPEIERQLEHLCTLSFTEAELLYLSNLPFFTNDFISFLKNYRLQDRFISLHPDGKNLDLQITGPLLEVALFEIYLLAIISELHTVHHCNGFHEKYARQLLQQKIDLLTTQNELENFSFADFGTRRRASRSWQQIVLETLAEQVPHYFSGTSNLHFARVLGLRPVGTMAHEWFQAWQAVTELADAQKAALQGWLREFQGQLSIALTDCYSMDAFIRDFTPPLSERYIGLRHDSGPPIQWGEKAIQMYADQGIDPKTKNLVFSDSLDFALMIQLHHSFSSRITTSFGIGTKLTNDVGNPPLDIVIKMVEANGRPVAKISDEPGKSICGDQAFLQQLARLYHIDRSSLSF